MRDLMFKNRKKEIKFSERFRQIFGVKLHDYMSYTTGFDSIRFDEHFIKSGEGCMRDKILAEYGEEGVKIVEDLIKYDS